MSTGHDSRLSYRVADKAVTESESGSSSGCAIQEDKQLEQAVSSEVVPMETQEGPAVIAAGQ